MTTTTTERWIAELTRRLPDHDLAALHRATAPVFPPATQPAGPRLAATGNRTPDPDPDPIGAALRGETDDDPVALAMRPEDHEWIAAHQHLAAGDPLADTARNLADILGDYAGELEALADGSDHHPVLLRDLADRLGELAGRIFPPPPGGRWPGDDVAAEVLAAAGEYDHDPTGPVCECGLADCVMLDDTGEWYSPGGAVIA